MNPTRPPEEPRMAPEEFAAATRTGRYEEMLSRFSLGRPVTVLVLLATMLVVGLVAAVGIPLETFPQGFSRPFLSVSVPWQDAPPQEVVDKILLPLEGELSTVRGVERITSRATTGRARVFLSFKGGTDMNVAYREVRDRLQRARPQLPDDADRLYIFKEDISGIPVVMVGLAVDPDLVDAYSLIQNEIVMPLQRIDGVATVSSQGLQQKEILIELDRRRTETAGLNIYQLAQELAGDNFSMASGHVFSGGDKLLLRSVARYDSIEALENRLLSNSVRLGDVATVRYEEPEKEWAARLNGRPAIALQVLKEGQANTVEVSREVVAAVERMQENPRLANIEISPFFVQGDLILGALETLLDSGRLGALFAILVLFFFLRRFRMTLIITLSIPLSMLIALTVMYFAGETLNILSLLALMICVGLLVDNSVVVAENIYRLHGKGLSARDACIRGAGEIALAITMATLTTIAVFLPVSLVEGDVQFFLLRLSVPISVSLAGSLIVALVFIPLSVYMTLPHAGDGRRSRVRAGGPSARQVVVRRLHERLNRALSRLYDAVMQPVSRLCSYLLERSLRRRFELIVITAMVCAGTFWLAFEGTEFGFQQDDERGGFEVDVELARSSTMEDAQEYFQAAETVLEAHKDEWDLQGYFIFHRTTSGSIEGWFNSPRTNDMTAREVTEAVVAVLPERGGITLYTGEESQVGDCDSDDLHCLVLYGDDPEQLEGLAGDLEGVFRQLPGVVGIQRNSEQTPSELALVIDRDRAQRQAVNPQAVAGVVGYALRGQALPKFYRDGEEIPVRVRYREEDRESLSELRNFEVLTDTGEAISLDTITDVELLSSPQAITRRNKQVARTMVLELAEGGEKEARRQIDDLSRSLDLPEGVSFGSPIRRGRDEGGEAMGMAMLLSIVFIYLLMAFLFESFILPLSILATIPLAGIGVGWAHYVAGMNLDFLGIIGAIVLTGVVVNNGIVLIDYVHRLRSEGLGRNQALLTATERRFRPILMTALTTICGAMPLIFGGKTEMGLSYTSFGLTLVGGMTTATLLTLLVVPVFYTLFDDAREIVGSAVIGVLRRGRRRDEKVEDASASTAGG